MNRHVVVFLVAAALGLALSGTPAAAQNQGNGKGQGPEAVNFCKVLVASETCSNADALGNCVATGNVCTNAFRTGNANLYALCCAKCFSAAEACDVNPLICTGFFGCAP